MNLKNDVNKFPFRKTFLLMLAGVIFVGILEIFLFNYKYYLTLGNEKINCQIQYGSGLEQVSDHKFKVIDSNNTAIIMEGFSEEINCLRLKMKRYDSIERRMVAATVDIFATDEANSTPLHLGERDVFSDVWRSQYAYLHLAGCSDMVKVVPRLSNGDELYVDNITINAKIPFHFMWQRAFFVFVFLVLIYLLRPASPLYAYSIACKNVMQRVGTVIFIILFSVFFVKLTFANPIYVDPPWTHHQQYQRLAEALAEGHFYLNEEPPNALKEMENPYDQNKRIEVMEQTNSSFFWDHAYYDGKYYVYFGIVPELIFYLPYYLITHTHIKTVWPIAICGVLIIFALTRLFKAILLKWFPKTSYVSYLLMCATCFISMGMVYVVSHAAFYSLPIMMGVFFGIMGIYFWLIAQKEGKVSGGYLFLGSLCMALIAGCRPQLLLTVLVVFPFFWTRTVKERQLFSKKTVCKTILAILPFVVVAVFLMYYNYARFGSAIDFGANYNLTTNDMTSRFASVHLCFAGIFAYFFQPASVGMVFPFLQYAPSQYSYLGNNIHEVMYGGFFMCNAISWVVLQFKKVGRLLRQKKLLGLFCLLFVISVIIALVDIIGAGILPRYQTDFTWLLLLAVSLVVFALEEYFGSNQVGMVTKQWRIVYLCLCLVTISYQVMLFFAYKDTFLSVGNPALYYRICYAVAFWL